MKTRMCVCIVAVAAAGCAVETAQESEGGPELSVTDFDTAQNAELEAEAMRSITLPQTVVRTPAGLQRIHYEVRDGIAYAQGDMILGPVDELPTPQEAEDVNFRGATPLFGNKWPNGVVNYVAPSFNQANIMAAINDWDSKTDLKFVQVPDAFLFNRLVFVADIFNPNVSSSHVGFQGGRQEIRVGLFAGAKRVMLHEIGHAVGFIHEHSRSDRDNFVNINWACILLGNLSSGSFSENNHNFEKIAAIPRSAYDFASIMHYSSWAFAGSGCTTITRKDGTTIGQNSVLSARDIVSTNAYY